jgi:hypothetical protein
MAAPSYLPMLADASSPGASEPLAPSLAAAALGASPKSLVRDPETFGRLLESMVHRDPSVYARAAGMEAKLSGAPDVLDAAAAGLVRIAAAMRAPPASLTIVTATTPSYTHSDGVDVTSILDLGP